jgi:3-deoxy-D-manno-octulosonic-acid transferase
LEAAVYSIPVIVGPYHQKHAEATDLIRRGGAFTFTEDQSATALKKILCDLLHQTEQCKSAGQIAGQYVKENAGATQRILDYIQEKRLLIN